MSVMTFKMWEPSRQSLMAEHRFYAEQAHKRLLSQFENMEVEADKAADEHLERMSIHFNPDKHDPSDFQEAAHDKGIEFYQSLSDMRDATQLGVVAGMYHQWDKQLREWIVSELRHWHTGEHANRAIWKADFLSIMDFLAAIGFDVKGLSYFPEINAMQLVVNVYKHGNGQSLDLLKKEFPQFLRNPYSAFGLEEAFQQYLNHSDMKLSVEHIAQFSDAILDFWESVPEAFVLPEETELPKWFEKAVLKGRAVP